MSSNADTTDTTDTTGKTTDTSDTTTETSDTTGKTTDTSDATGKTTTNKYAKDNYMDNTTLILTASFLAIYFVVYAITGLFYDSSDPSQSSAKATMVDVVILILLLFAGWVYYASLPPQNQETYWTDIGSGVKAYLNNAYSILGVIVFIVVLYLGIFIFGIPMTQEGKPWIVDFLESKSFILLFILSFIQFFKYVLNIDIIGVIFGDIAMPVLLPDTTASTSTSTIKQPIPDKKEVFNISNNLYTYEDAKAVCKAMGSELANYDQVEEAYNSGAEWTSYGWSEGQHAYFPTQKETWNKLQTVKGHQHDLGRPGVNGGYFANPNIRFGVNCYGVKPPSTDQEKALMSAQKDRVYPASKEDRALDAKVAYWKANRDKMLVINGFNTDKWSRF
jgi:hypothetical protein